MKKPAKARRAPSRSAYHHGDLPRALRDAARELLVEGGTDALTLRQVASLAGVNHRAVYRHYEDKRALLASLAQEGFERLTARIRAAMDKGPDDPRERLLSLGVAYLRFAQENTALFRLMFGRRLNEDDRFPWLEPAVAAPLILLIAEIERGVDARRFTAGSARDRAISVWTMVHGYTDLVLLKRIRVRTQTIARRYIGEVLAPLLDGLGTP